jgi:hypothetical protein
VAGQLAAAGALGLPGCGVNCRPVRTRRRTRGGDTHPLAKTVDLVSKAARDHWLPFLVDTGDSTSHVEDSWVGQATVRVRGVVPRCGVVNLDPVTAQNDASVLAEHPVCRLSRGEINFGVDAVVTAPGRVRTGDRVELEEG